KKHSSILCPPRESGISPGRSLLPPRRRRPHMAGPDIPWSEGLTVPQMLAKTVDRCGDADAVVFPQCGYRRTYRQFQAEVREYARALLALCVQRGDMVGIWATNWPQWIVTQFAVAQIGAVLVNVN